MKLVLGKSMQILFKKFNLKWQLVFNAVFDTKLLPKFVLKSWRLGTILQELNCEKVDGT